jgi:hypothetical protein
VTNKRTEVQRLLEAAGGGGGGGGAGAAPGTAALQAAAVG